MRKRLVSILFIVAMLFSLTVPAFADAEPAAETPAAAEDAPAEAAPTETPAETGGGEGASADLPDSAPADENAPASAPAAEPAAPAAAESAPVAAPAASALAAAGSNDTLAAAANVNAPAAVANDGAGSPAPVTKAAAAPAAVDSAGEANAEGGSEKAADASKDTPKAAASEEKAIGTEDAEAEGQEQSAADSAQGGSEDETSADGQKESSEEAAGEDEKKSAEEAGEDEKEPAEEEGEDENEPAEEEGKDENEPAEEEGKGENEPAEEEGKSENEPAEEEDEDLALGGSLTGEDGLKDAEQTEGGADADGGDAGLETVGGAQAAGSGQSSDIYTLIQNINAGTELTAYIAGMTAEARQSMIDILQSSLDQAIKDNKPLKITDVALPDAEKYMLSGYDELLCWAATAANMLWTSQIAQQSINPATNTNFQTVDEVFDYFRTVFTDQVGRPDGALSVFLKGTYPFQNSAGLSQLKDPGSVSKRLPDGIQTPDFGLFNLQGENVKDIAAFEKLDIQSLGVLLHSYDNVDKKMGSLAHWVTSPGIIIDNTKTGLERFKAIMIADSDNDPINGDDSIPNAEKAAKAAKAPNSYTVYPLTLKTFSTIGQRWTIPFYTRPDQSDFDVLIDWVAFVASIEPATKKSEDILPGDEDDWDDDGWDEDDWDYEWEYDEDDEDEPAPASEGSANGPSIAIIPADFNWDDFDWDDFDWEDYDWEDMDMDELDEFLDAVPADRLPELIALAKEQDGGSGFLEAVKNRMAEMNLEIFSPADWKYSLSKDGTFLVVVRTDPTQLLNVLLDGRLLTEYQKDFEVIDENTGTFLLVFSKDVMQSLEAGEHTLTLEINGIGELVRTITVLK